MSLLDIKNTYFSNVGAFSDEKEVERSKMVVNPGTRNERCWCHVDAKFGAENNSQISVIQMI